LAAAIVNNAVRCLYQKQTKCEASRGAEERGLEALFWLAFSPQCKLFLECLGIDDDPLTVFERGLPDKLPNMGRGRGS
jgi:hypothetical protein